MKTVIIVQARMTSTRLPGKILREVLGRPLLAYQIDRLRRVREAHEVVIATTTNATDEPVVDFCAGNGIQAFRGSEDDVLSRYYGAALEHGATTVVRVTSDCPMIDPAVIDRVIAEFASADPAIDYASNTLTRTYPRGLDCEVFSLAALTAAHFEAVDAPEREHVTPFLYHHPERFNLLNIAHNVDLSRLRWTVDTPEDFHLIRLMLEHLYVRKPDFALEDCLRMLAEHPEWTAINAHVEQKVYGQ